MIIAITITIILTISFTTRTDTQASKLEEESQKALAAAEAGIDSSLKNKFGIGDLTTLGDLGKNITSGSTTITLSGSDVFTSPKLVSSEAYTTYLGAYTAGPPPSYASSTASDITICFGDASTQPSLDIALLKDSTSTPTVRRYLADPAGNTFGGTNKLTVTPGCSGNPAFAYSVRIDGTEVGADSTMLVIRAMFASTKLFISHAGLPTQGTTVTSQATTSTGVSKKVRLFQSYPQIPAEFFFTTF